MRAKIYAEGGGDHNKALETEFRRGFSLFFQRAGLIRPYTPSVVRCGGRQQAYNRFRTAQEQPETNVLPILLVDSEQPVVSQNKWDHVRQRDGWQCPEGASEDQIHFMVEAMEAWFHADKPTLQRYYGNCFRPAALSQRRDIESIPKEDLFSGLQRATNDCQQKGEYSKGEHSFKILPQLDPAKVQAASPCAKRLLDTLNHLSAP